MNIEKWSIHDSNGQSMFWDDIGNKDVFNIHTGDFSKFEDNILKHGFIKDIEKCLSYLNNQGIRIEGTGIELAAGTLWLTSYILNQYGNNIEKYYALEMSESLLMNLGAKVLRYYKVNTKNLNACVGSFYNIKLPDESVDFVVICQAFHHADDPDRLLREIRRVLRRGGYVIMIGELYISKLLYAKCYLNYLVSRIVMSRYIPNLLKRKIGFLNRISSKPFQGTFQEIYFPPDKVTGDHYHLKTQYTSFFRKNGFQYANIKAELCNHLSYILFKQ